MIKCSVTINGTISRAAQMRTDKDNNSFVSFPVSVVLPAKSGINKTVEVSVSMSGTQTDCPKFQPNQRVEMQGMLTLRKKGDALYFNFMAGSVNLQPSETKDKIEGEMEFRGALGGKGIVLKNDKKGNHFLREDWRELRVYMGAFRSLLRRQGSISPAQGKGQRQRYCRVLRVQRQG
mgnify:CR=1 FL=1